MRHRARNLMISGAYQKVYPKSSRYAAEWGFTRLQKNVGFAARVTELGNRKGRNALSRGPQYRDRVPLGWRRI
jgi:hypothetical protein